MTEDQAKYGYVSRSNPNSKMRDCLGSSGSKSGVLSVALPGISWRSTPRHEHYFWLWLDGLRRSRWVPFPASLLVGDL